MLKRIWTTDDVHDSVSLTLESDLDKGQLCVRELNFPDRETEKPRHTMVISSLTPEDINILAEYLDLIRTDL